jgi:hypothetical protein
MSQHITQEKINILACQQSTASYFVKVQGAGNYVYNRRAFDEVLPFMDLLDAETYSSKPLIYSRLLVQRISLFIPKVCFILVNGKVDVLLSIQSPLSWMISKRMILRFMNPAGTLYHLPAWGYGVRIVGKWEKWTCIWTKAKL